MLFMRSGLGLAHLQSSLSIYLLARLELLLSATGFGLFSVRPVVWISLQIASSVFELEGCYVY